MAVQLTDDQIEQLLSAAEFSLANKSAGSTSAGVNQKQQRKASVVAKASATAKAKDIKAGNNPVRPLKDLDVRVPKLMVKGKKEARDDAGAAWNYMPRTKIEDPKVKREFQLLRLRGVIDTKKHWKKDIRKDPFPKYSQMGTLIEGPTDFYSGRLTRKDRKQTLVEEVLASGETNNKFTIRYAKIQEKKTSGKKAYYKKLMARRRKG